MVVQADAERCDAGGTNESRRKTWIPRLEAVVVLVAVLVGGGCGGSDD